MLGKNHTAVNVTGLIAGVSLGAYLEQTGPEWVSGWMTRVGDWMMVGYTEWLLLPAVIVGSYLPDIDNKNSKISSFIKTSLGGPHRGATHSIWHIILWLCVSLWEPTRFCIGLAIGVAGHLVADSLSRGGIAWFYPLGRYRRYQLRPGVWAIGPSRYHRSLYTVGQRSEAMVTRVWVGMNLVAGLSPWVLGALNRGGV